MPWNNGQNDDVSVSKHVEANGGWLAWVQTKKYTTRNGVADMAVRSLTQGNGKVEAAGSTFPAWRIVSVSTCGCISPDR